MGDSSPDLFGAEHCVVPKSLCTTQGSGLMGANKQRGASWESGAKPKFRNANRGEKTREKLDLGVVVRHVTGVASWTSLPRYYFARDSGVDLVYWLVLMWFCSVDTRFYWSQTRVELGEKGNLMNVSEERNMVEI